MISVSYLWRDTLHGCTRGDVRYFNLSEKIDKLKLRKELVKYLSEIHVNEFTGKSRFVRLVSIETIKEKKS